MGEGFLILVAAANPAIVWPSVLERMHQLSAVILFV